MSKRVYLKEYDINLTANGIQVLLVEGEYFRIQSSSGAISVNVDGLGELPGLLAGQGIGNTPFKRLVLRDVSGLVNVGKLLVSNEEFIDNRTFGVSTLDAATLAALESIDLNAATINSLKLPTPRPEAATGFYSGSGALVANTPDQIFTPASNPNGAILLSAGIGHFENASGALIFLAKSTPPVTYLDGEVMFAAAFTNVTYTNNMPGPVFVAPGRGLYFISNAALTANFPNFRHCRYRLL